MVSSLQCFDAEPSQSAGGWKHINTGLDPKSKTASPAAGLQPLAHFAEAVVAPERLAIDDEEGRAEHTLVHRQLHFLAQALLDGGVLHAGEDCGALVAEADRQIDGRLRFRRRLAGDEGGVVGGARIGLRVLRATAVQPIENPAWIDRGEWKRLRQRELDA